MDLRTQWGKGRVGGTETVALTYTHYQVHNTRGSVPCSVMTSRGGMRGREGGFRGRGYMHTFS